jgi:peroxin-5
MDGFIQQPILPQVGPAQPFAMEQMRRELDKVALDNSRTASPNWAAEFKPEQAGPTFRPHNNTIPGFNALEFQKFQMNSRQSTPDQVYNQKQWQPQFINSGYIGMQSPQFLPMQQQQQQPIMDKGKGKMVELDDKNWEQQFAEMDALEGDDTETVHGDFESIWESIQAERASRQFESSDYDMNLDNMDPWSNFDSLGSSFRDPQLGNYLFEEDNIYQNIDDPFQEGVKIMQEAGNLSLAALAFEAAVQKNPEHVQAWTMLGAAQAQNEKESPAIRALEQALKLDPSNLDALMGLAVSYTNEGYDATAYRTLERWLSTKYPNIISPNNLSSPNDIGFTDRQALHEKVTNLFIKAAQLSPDGEHMDPDVQVGLGVLFYGAEEYDKAVDCFSAALASTESGSTNQREQVHLLWNRLGATLANSGRSEEAIAAYERALTFNANFVRARYNLGVSCINIGCYAEAAQHLLGALSMHSVVEKAGIQRVEEITGNKGASDAQIDRLIAMNQSTNLYETLRRVFTQMNRPDLAEKIVPGVNVGIFRSEFDF